jgi:hypothetical protein
MKRVRVPSFPRKTTTSAQPKLIFGKEKASAINGQGLLTQQAK